MPSQPQQAQESFADLRFPLGGIDLSRGFNNQMPRPLQNGDYGGTTPQGQNVRGYEPGTQRARGGQRPGLLKYIPGLVGAASLIQELNVVVGVGYTPPGPGGGNPYLAQPVVTAPTGTTTVTVHFNSPVTTGNAIIVATAGQGGFPTVTDAAGNSYTRTQNNSVDASQSSIFYSVGVTGGFTSVSAAFANSTANGVFVFEVGGVPITSPKDVSNSASSTNSTSGTFGSITTTLQPDFIVGVIGATTGNPSLVGTVFSPQFGANPLFMAIYLPVAASGTYNPAFNLTHLSEWCASIVAFKA